MYTRVSPPYATLRRMKETNMTKVDIEPKKMKIICCGQWKTATKSCTAALKVLGYNPRQSWSLHFSDSPVASLSDDLTARIKRLYGYDDVFIKSLVEIFGW